MSRCAGRRRTLALGLMLFATLAASGCVRRRYTVRSNVPAVVFVNNEEVGPTPVSREFTFYGDREFLLVAPGYEPLKVIRKVDAPWWDNMFTEFFTENLVPYTFRDERTFDFELKPARPPAVEALVGEAEGLRQKGRTIPPPRRGGFLGFLGF